MKNEYNKDRSNTLIIGGIVVSVLFIVTIVIFSIFGGKKLNSRTNDNVTPADSQEDDLSDTIELSAVFLEADTSFKKITVRDVVSGEMTMFEYTGGTKITDKYDQPITVSQLVKGQVVTLNYIRDTKRLTTLSIANNVWENIGITDVIINHEANVISYLGKNYSYGEGLVVFSQGKMVDLKEVLSMDYLTIRGFEEHIYSIVVTSGHGYLELEEEEQILGGTIYVGTQVVEQITEDMRLIVPEGTHTVTVNSQGAEGFTEVVITRNLTTVCKAEEFGIEALQTGKVAFLIYPEEASLFLDKEPVTYVEPVELKVGEHEIEVSLGGYVSYHGTIVVDIYGTTVSITLYENKAATTEETISEDDEIQADDVDWDGSNDNTSEDDSDSDPDPQTDPISGNTNEEEEPDQNTEETLTIQWTTGAEVFFNGEYVGVIEDGKLTVEKQIGEITVDLVVEGEDTITYDITVEDNGKDAVFTFPGR